MTIARENLKTEKRRAEVGERVIGTGSGTIYEVEGVDERGIYGKSDGCVGILAGHHEYEVIIEPERVIKQIRNKIKRMQDASADDKERIKRQEAAIQSLQAENARIPQLEQQIKIATAETERVKRMQFESVEYEQLQKEYEELSEQWKNATDKADELQTKMLDWKAKYEQEHLDHLEAKAVIEETRKNLLAGWEDDSEELNVTRHALAHAEQNNSRLTAHARELEQRNKQLEKHLEDLQNARMNINDRWAQSDEKFQAELVRDRKLIGALMEYIQEG